MDLTEIPELNALLVKARKLAQPSDSSFPIKEQSKMINRMLWIARTENISTNLCVTEIV